MKNTDPRTSSHEPTAETAYLFRHALLRDAAYDLQLPGERAQLHALALAALEDFLQRLGDPLRLEQAAHELAGHARLAAQQRPTPELLHAEVQYLGKAAALADRNYQYAAGVRMQLRLAEITTGIPRASALYRAGVHLAKLRRLSEADEILARAITEARQAGAMELEGSCHGARFNVQAARADYHAAEESGRASAACFRSKNAHGPALRAEAVLAGLLADTGRTLEAMPMLEAALAEARALGEPSVLAAVLGVRATMLNNSGRHQDALGAFLQVLEIDIASGNEWAAAMTRSQVATAYARLGRHADAEAATRAALAGMRKTGNLARYAAELANLGSLMANTGRTKQATEVLLQAMEMMAELGDARGIGVARHNLGEISLELNDVGAARILFEQALQLHVQVRNRRFEAFSSANLALCLLAQGDRPAAQVFWARAAAIFASLGDQTLQPEHTGHMEKFCAARGLPCLD